ncbi:NAD-dependent 4,6-dehydratase LegB [Pelagibacterales bacterium]|nr:NAD-dependent 4,6-dehydratase LegB [Pelagibacterales bacterium]
MKVLVTGADGFIGSHLTEKLFKEGFEVRALSQYNSFNDWGWLEHIEFKDDIEIISGDIRDSHFCNEITKNIDVVFHLAALIAIPYSYLAPQSYIDTNITGTLNICQAAKNNNVKRIIHTSTSEVYGTAKYVPIDEKHILQPQSPYSASKIGAESIAMSYYNSFELPVTILRPFNTYGPRQSARAVIPTIISQIASNEKNISIGEITPTRDFTFVEDTCNGFLEVAKCDNLNGLTLNLGSNFEVSIEDTIKKIKKIMKSDKEVKHELNRVRPKNSEVNRLYCDNSLIKKLTNFKINNSFEQGLLKTIEWFKNPENLKKYKTSIYNI